MKLKTVKVLLRCVIGLEVAAVLLGLMIIGLREIFLGAALLLLIAYAVLARALWRCPHCGGHLAANTKGTHCPHCGKDVGIEMRI